MSKEQLVHLLMQTDGDSFKFELQGKRSDVMSAFLYAMNDEPAFADLLKACVSFHESQEYQEAFLNKVKGDA
jgi:hypothetical protein